MTVMTIRRRANLSGLVAPAAPAAVLGRRTPARSDPRYGRPLAQDQGKYAFRTIGSGCEGYVRVAVLRRDK
jgi:hypothetical protein